MHSDVTAAVLAYWCGRSRTAQLTLSLRRVPRWRDAGSKETVLARSPLWPAQLDHPSRQRPAIADRFHRRALGMTLPASTMAQC